MFADVLPPPTFVNDWYMVGWPASLVVPCALAASLIALVVGLVRRHRPVRNTVIIVGAVMLFVLADYAVYEIGCSYQDLWRTRRERPPIPAVLERDR